MEQISVPDGFTQTLNDHLLLVYTGKTRLARNLLQVMPGCHRLASAPPVAFHGIPFIVQSFGTPEGAGTQRL